VNPFNPSEKEGNVFPLCGKLFGKKRKRIPTSIMAQMHLE
jgi:hypothetical protein